MTEFEVLTAVMFKYFMIMMLMLLFLKPVWVGDLMQQILLKEIFAQLLRMLILTILKGLEIRLMKLHQKSRNYQAELPLYCI